MPNSRELLRILSFRHLAAAIAVLALALAPASVAAAAPAVPYVNMGDSASSGSGIVPLAAGAPAVCSRSTLNWGNALAKARGYQLTDVSCSGAQTKDYGSPQAADVAPQLNALSTSTRVVTMTIGGNDNNTFYSAVNACISLGARAGGKGSPCKDAYGSSFETTIRDSTYPNLVSTLFAVKKKAPYARIAISSYLPLLPASQGCYPYVPVAVGDVPYLNGIQTVLNDAVKRAATAAGVVFVDQSVAAVGRDACKPIGVRWVEPVYGTRSATALHPNATGEQAMANRAAVVLG